MKTLFRISTILAVAGVAAAFQTPPLPPPFHSESVNNGPTVIARPEGVQLKLPAGFKIETAAEGFDVPRFMLRAPGGEILLSDAARDYGTTFRDEVRKLEGKPYYAPRELERKKK